MVIAFLGRMRIYDEALFTNFATHLGSIVKQASIVAPGSGKEVMMQQIEKATM